MRATTLRLTQSYAASNSLAKRVRLNAGLGVGLHPRLEVAEIDGCPRRSLVFAHEDCLTESTPFEGIFSAQVVGAGTIVGFVPSRRALDRGSMRDADTYGILPSDEECAAAVSLFHRSSSLSSTHHEMGESGTSSSKAQTDTEAQTDGDHDGSDDVENALLSFMAADALARQTSFGKWVDTVLIKSSEERHACTNKAASSAASPLSSLVDFEEGRACQEMHRHADDLVLHVRSVLRDDSLCKHKGYSTGGGKRRHALVPAKANLLRARRYVTSSFAVVGQIEGGTDANAGEDAASLIPLVDILNNAVVDRRCRVSVGAADCADNGERQDERTDGDGVVTSNTRRSQQKRGVELVHHSLSPNVSMAMCSAASLRQLLKKSSVTKANGIATDASPRPKVLLGAAAESLLSREALREDARIEALDHVFTREDAYQESMDMSQPRKGVTKGIRSKPKGRREVFMTRTHYAACHCGVGDWLRWVSLRGRRHNERRGAACGRSASLLFPAVGGRMLLRLASPRDQYFIFYTTKEVEIGSTLFMTSSVMVRTLGNAQSINKYNNSSISDVKSSGGEGERTTAHDEPPTAAALFRAGVEE